LKLGDARLIILLPDYIECILIGKIDKVGEIIKTVDAHHPLSVKFLVKKTV